MMQKPVPNYLFLLFIFNILIGILISFPALSASVIVTKNKAPTYQQAQKTSPSTLPQSKVAFERSSFLKPLSFNKPIKLPRLKHSSIQNKQRKNQTTNKKSLAFIQNNRYQQGKQFVIENSHNDFIQESLNIFYTTKHILQETDKIILDLSQQILLSLQLEQILANNQLLILQKNSAEYSIQNQYKALKDEDLSMLTKSPNFYIALETEYILALINQIFQIENLLYLIAVIFFYGIVKGSVKFILLKKQRKQKYRLN